jgi:hypothetical protein
MTCLLLDLVLACHLVLMRHTKQCKQADMASKLTGWHPHPPPLLQWPKNQQP